MKLLTENQLTPPVYSLTGANIGDKVIFSPHNPKNANMTTTDITFNKIYTINYINEAGETTFLDNVFAINYHGGGSPSCMGEYDIIDKNEPQIDLEATKAYLVLESKAEIDLITTVLGGVSDAETRKFNNGKVMELFPVWTLLDKMSSELPIRYVGNFIDI